eukprot:1194813-Prorocentrum_minimum.AAC.3
MFSPAAGRGAESGAQSEPARPRGGLRTLPGYRARRWHLRIRQPGVRTSDLVESSRHRQSSLQPRDDIGGVVSSAGAVQRHRRLAVGERGGHPQQADPGGVFVLPVSVPGGAGGLRRRDAADPHAVGELQRREPPAESLRRLRAVHRGHPRDHAPHRSIVDRPLLSQS